MFEPYAFFFRQKWPSGFFCPRCCFPDAYVIRTRKQPLYQCKTCRHQTSLTAGTVMEGTRTPLFKWAAAIRYLSMPGSINALQLSRRIDVTYKTAWAMLMKIRQALTAADEAFRLRGRVTCAVAYYGRPNVHFIRHPQEHPVIVAIGTPSNGEPSYVKIQCIPDRHLDDKWLLRSGKDDFAQKHVHPASVVAFLNRVQYHRSFVLPPLFNRAKTWINRTFHGIGPKYLQQYWDEYCFRANRSWQELPTRDALASICMRTPKGPQPFKLHFGWKRELLAG